MNDFQQLSLAIKLDNQATFDNFYAPTGTPQHLAKMLLQDEGSAHVALNNSQTIGPTLLQKILVRIFNFSFLNSVAK